MASSNQNGAKRLIPVASSSGDFSLFGKVSPSAHRKTQPGSKKFCGLRREIIRSQEGRRNSASCRQHSGAFRSPRSGGSGVNGSCSHQRFHSRELPVYMWLPAPIAGEPLTIPSRRNSTRRARDGEDLFAREVFLFHSDIAVSGSVSDSGRAGNYSSPCSTNFRNICSASVVERYSPDS